MGTSTSPPYSEHVDFYSAYAQGFARVAAITLPVAIADPATNARRTIEQARAASEDNVAVAVFPELGLSGYSIEDLFLQDPLLDAVRVPMRPSLLPFTPWETLAGYVGLLRWVAERDLVGCVDPVMLSIRLLVPPGSSLLAEAESAAWLGELDAANFTHRWAHPDPRMDDLHRQVAAIVERAAPEHEPTADTFGRIWDAAHAVAGVPGTPRPAPAVRRPPAPRLTESWFC